jgi:hypothetical protein
MAKAKAKDILAGLPAARKKKIRAQIKEEKNAARKEADKDYDVLFGNLVSLRNRIDNIIREERNQNKIPKGTTIKKLASLSAKKPTLVGNYVKKNFGSTLVQADKSVQKAQKVFPPATKTPAKKVKYPAATKTPAKKKPAAKKK